MKGSSKKYKPNKDSLALRVNEKIRVKKVRLISSEGEQIGIVDTAEAMSQAQEQGLDLIEIAPDAKPPVCRIGDFGKMRYDHSKKKKQQQKKQSQNTTKTVKFSPNIGENDLSRKINDAQRFLDKGFKVLVCIDMKGRQNKHPELAFRLAETVQHNLEADIFEKINKQGSRVTLTAMQSPTFEKKSVAPEEENKLQENSHDK